MTKEKVIFIAAGVFAVLMVINSFFFTKKIMNRNRNTVTETPWPTEETVYYQDRLELAEPYANKYGYISYHFTMPEYKQD